MGGRFFYGWVIVAITAVVLLATAGIRAAPSAFLLSDGAPSAEPIPPTARLDA